MRTLLPAALVVGLTIGVFLVPWPDLSSLAPQNTATSYLLTLWQVVATALTLSFALGFFLLEVVGGSGPRRLRRLGVQRRFILLIGVGLGLTVLIGGVLLVGGPEGSGGTAVTVLSGLAVVGLGIALRWAWALTGPGQDVASSEAELAAIIDRSIDEILRTYVASGELDRLTESWGGRVVVLTYPGPASRCALAAERGTVRDLRLPVLRLVLHLSSRRSPERKAVLRVGPGEHVDAGDALIEFPDEPSRPLRLLGRHAFVVRKDRRDPRIVDLVEEMHEQALDATRSGSLRAYRPVGAFYRLLLPQLARSWSRYGAQAHRQIHGDLPLWGPDPLHYVVLRLRATLDAASRGPEREIAREIVDTLGVSLIGMAGLGANPTATSVVGLLRDCFYLDASQDRPQIAEMRESASAHLVLHGNQLRRQAESAETVADAQRFADPLESLVEDLSVLLVHLAQAGQQSEANKFLTAIGRWTHDDDQDLYVGFPQSSGPLHPLLTLPGSWRRQQFTVTALLLLRVIRGNGVPNDALRGWTGWFTDTREVCRLASDVMDLGIKSFWARSLLQDGHSLGTGPPSALLRPLAALLMASTRPPTEPTLEDESSLLAESTLFLVYPNELEAAVNEVAGTSTLMTALGVTDAADRRAALLAAIRSTATAAAQAYETRVRTDPIRGDQKASLAAGVAEAFREDGPPLLTALVRLGAATMAPTAAARSVGAIEETADVPRAMLVGRSSPALINTWGRNLGTQLATKESKDVIDALVSAATVCPVARGELAAQVKTALQDVARGSPHTTVVAVADPRLLSDVGADRPGDDPEWQQPFKLRQMYRGHVGDAFLFWWPQAPDDTVLVLNPRLALSYTAARVPWVRVGDLGLLEESVVASVPAAYELADHPAAVLLRLED